MITVVIVNWNSGNFLRQCIEDLRKQDLSPSKVLVVDNSSDDGSADFIDNLTGIELHRLNSNLGFAGGNNYALELIDTEYVALLNPDAFPEPGWLQEMMSAANEYEEAVAFGSCQMLHDSDGLIDGMGDVCHISGLIWRRGHGHPLLKLGRTPFEIFSPCAGAAIYRTDAVKALGGFDEDFFCYVEDVDLGFRLRLSGYKAMLVPGAIVHHVGSAMSGGKHSDFSIYHGHRNLVWTYIKNMPGWLFWLCLPFHITINIISILWFIFHGKGAVILKAKRDAIYGLPDAWQKRKKTQRDRLVSVREIWRVLDKRIWLSKE